MLDFGDQATIAQEWIEQHFRSWAKALTASEREALRRYKTDGGIYRELNRWLRLADPELAHPEEPGDGLIELVEDLDVAIARMRCPVDIVAWRGFADPALAAFMAREPDGLIGSSIEDPAYLSASVLRDIAEEFVRHAEPAESRIMLRIEIPGGSELAAYLAAPDLVSGPWEAEVLLPRSTLLRVQSITPPEASFPHPILNTEVIP